MIQFLNHYPFGSTMTILTDGKSLDLIILKDSRFIKTNSGEKLVLDHFHRAVK
ncbi:hypothetical protein [Listeria immobilis]|uniref:hypothetical protein n=1 Tax=Listeria immobilis TaxID=2713502 RepID=UPI001629A873|nr:hypothetical protein [Listeria immobilis]MBC1515773.1 hypothetical protein [Listeria immobilis]